MNEPAIPWDKPAHLWEIVSSTKPMCPHCGTYMSAEVFRVAQSFEWECEFCASTYHCEVRPVFSFITKPVVEGVE